MSRLPPLIALRAFEAVGRTGSVRAAGQELGVSHTVVSRHVHNLETRLQARLLAPHGRGVELTAEGATFHAEIVRAFEIIAQAAIALGQERRRTLDIWCMPGLANWRLLPRIGDLAAQLAGHEIILNPTLARPNLERGEADAEIVFLAAADARPGRTAELLACPRMFPVASPGFCARFGRPETLADLVRLPLIHEESTAQWAAWLAAAGHAPHTPLHGPCLWHAHLAAEAARLGQGVALTNGILAAEELHAGTLLELCTSDVTMGGYYLVALAARDRDPALRALRGWLADIFGETGAKNAPVPPN
ncbi:LysR substrate-binding domain-containing protein [Aquabacter spiritensis]|uniref:LysR family transcriptional regulator n=1 Tax=Aquabacter spiritensis TaxID=933073 RepID=A0A4R3LYV9_9HYPH|nr:LysR substrate-binding domain-containing protein [Aquabacter spiritensis]TCT05663.1 LysR family transcriptional regulator [Aquabacter spiritensis]